MAFPFRNLFGKTEDGLPHPNVPASEGDGNPLSAPPTVSPTSGLPFSPAPPAQSSMRPMSGVSSPFQPMNPGSVQTYQLGVSELLQAIPEALRGQNPPPQGQVALQLPTTAVDPVRRTLSTSLSRVYQACPQLFSAPVVTENDQIVRLSLPASTAGTPVIGQGQPPQPVASGPPELPSRVAVHASPKIPAPVFAAAASAPVGAAANSPFMVVNTPATTVGGSGGAQGDPGMFQAPAPSVGTPPLNPPVSGPSMTSPFQVVNQNKGGSDAGSSQVPVPTPRSPAGASFSIPPTPGAPVGEGVGAVPGGVAPASDLQPLIDDEIDEPIVEDEGPGFPPPVHEVAAPSIPGVMADGEPSVTFALPQLLMRLDLATLGFEVTALPPSAKMQVPLSLVKSQLSSGRVVLSLAQVMQYSDRGSKPVLSRANPGLQVSLPLKEIFRQMPADVLASRETQAPSVRAEAAALETPFSAGARKDAELLGGEVHSGSIASDVARPDAAELAGAPEAGGEAAEEMEAEDSAALQMKAFLERQEEPSDGEDVMDLFSDSEGAGDLQPFPEDYLSAADEPEEEIALSGEWEVDDLDALVVAEEPVVSEEEGGSPDDGYGDMVIEDEASTFEGNQSELQDPPEPYMEEMIEEPPAAESTIEPQPLPSVPVEEPTPVAPGRSVKPAVASGPSSAGGFGGIGFMGPSRDIELRAVFGSEDEFTPQRVAERTASLPGIAGCVIFDRESRVYGEQLPSDQGVSGLAETMSRVYERVTGLASDLGFASSEAFTLHSAQGILSFYGEGDICLGILHEAQDFEAGVREKLVLIARGASQILGAELSS